MRPCVVISIHQLKWKSDRFSQSTRINTTPRSPLKQCVCCTLSKLLLDFLPHKHPQHHQPLSQPTDRLIRFRPRSRVEARYWWRCVRSPGSGDTVWALAVPFQVNNRRLVYGWRVGVGECGSEREHGTSGRESILLLLVPVQDGGGRRDDDAFSLLNETEVLQCSRIESTCLHDWKDWL